MFGQVGWLLLGTCQFDLEGGRIIPALKCVEVAFPPYQYIKKNSHLCRLLMASKDLLSMDQ